MKPWNGYDSTSAYSDADKEKLPPGGYVLRVTGVRMDSGRNGGSDIMVIEFDVDEGEYAGFYRRNYEGQPESGRRWKGAYRLFCPRDDGTDADERTKRRFKTAVKCFEESNAGYRWDWDERKLVGKIVGGIFNRKEYDYNGYHGFYTNCYSLASAERIRNGSFAIPEDTRLKPAMPGPAPAYPSDGGFVNIPDGIDEELPFV